MDGMEGTEGKACAMICGEPEVLEKLMQSLLGMADVADEQGLREEADTLSALIPDVKMMKAAQYEGFQNYWIANSRAFELSFKQRLEAQKEDKKSYQRAWMETLQDYMDSLLGPQTEFIGKHLKTAQYEGFQNYWLMNSRAFELAFKKKLEAQSEKEKSFFKAWMEVLEDYQDCEDRQEFLQDALKKTASKSENDMAMVVLAEADRKKVTLADLYCEWADFHKTALSGMLVLAAKKIEGGQLPAVAVYEALDYFSSGSHSRNTIRKIQSCANKIEEKLLKSAGFMDELRKMWWGWKSSISDVWDKITFQSGVGSSFLNKINAMGNWFKKQYDNLKAQVSAGGVIDPATLNHEIAPYIEELRSFVQLANSTGSASRVAGDFPELFVGGAVNLDYYDPDIKGVGEQQFDAYMSKVAAILKQVTASAKQYDKAAKEGIVGTTPPSMGGKFETLLSNALTVSTKRLAQELKKYSNTIPFDQMINEVQSPPTPWPTLLEEAAKNSGVAQGRVESEGSVADAANDLTSSYMNIVTQYLHRLINEVKHSGSPSTQKTTLQQIEAISKAHASSTGERIKSLIIEKFNLAARKA
jgi:hypothetical protein